MFSTDADLKIKQPLSQFFASQLLNLEWMQPGNGVHKLFSAGCDIRDGANNTLVTAYAALRPDGAWSLLVINKDQENTHAARISFANASVSGASSFSGPITLKTFGKAQYQWHPSRTGGTADPDGPIVSSTVNADSATSFTLPAASVTVIRGNIKPSDHAH
jgi:hypothetical protein